MFARHSGTREQYTVINEEHNNAALQLLNSEQKKQLHLFKQEIQNEYPEEAKDIVTLVRFLRAKNFNLEAAKKQFVQRMVLQWIQSFKPHTFREEEFKSIIKDGAIFMFGRDKHQRPIVIFRSCNHFAASDCTEHFRYIVFLVESGLLQLPPPPYDQFIFISDRTNGGRANLDFALVRKIAELNTYYPNLLHQLVVLNANWLFTMVYNVAKLLVDAATLEKVKIFYSLQEAKEYFDETIGEENLTISMGGTIQHLHNKNIVEKILPKSAPVELVLGTKRLKSASEKEVRIEF